MPAQLPDLTLADARAWREWLGRNHASSDGVWLRLAKKGTVEPTSLRFEQALEEALCHGWIDGQNRSLDTVTYIQRFTARRRRSTWSQRNVAHAERLIEEGRMHAAGLAEVERAKTDGRWQAAYAGQATIETPPDLLAALAANPAARRMFDTLTSQNRYAVILRISSLTTTDARARRIERYVAMLARGDTIHPQRRSA
jgi:uncharacterized protein YdeI (YjbR/CyaY-like superfamily)